MATIEQERTVTELQGVVIDGRPSSGNGDPETLRDPSNGELIADLPGAGREQVDAAVLSAHKAFPVWSAMTPKERSWRMLRIADAIEARTDELAELEMRNCGKPLGTARAVDVGNTVDVFRFFAGALRTPAAFRLASTRRGTLPCCAATPSAWWSASRLGTTR
jgi:acyl-CoA reductase-like NAD-dependent aldehyde dehydrogenase